MTTFARRRYFGVRHNQEGVVKRALGELFARGFGDYGYVNFRTRREWSAERERLFASEVRNRGFRAHVFKSWVKGKDDDIVAFDQRLTEFIAVNAIYSQCGYRDERSLRHVFTKFVGMSPLAYRKSMR